MATQIKHYLTDDGRFTLCPTPRSRYIAAAILKADVTCKRCIAILAAAS